MYNHCNTLFLLCVFTQEGPFSLNKHTISAPLSGLATSTSASRLHNRGGENTFGRDISFKIQGIASGF